MPYIKTVPPAEATGKLKEVYESGSGPSAARGNVSMIRQVQSLNPDNLAAWRALDVSIMRSESRITRRQREMIATVVSATNHCSYWMTAHGEALRSESKDGPLVEGIKQDYTKLDLPATERAMLDYAVKLTVAPSTVSEADVQTLRAHGFDDRDILDIVYVICLYNFNDRMADATGITGHDFLHG